MGIDELYEEWLEEQRMNDCLLGKQQIIENTDYYYPNSKAMERRLNKLLLAQHKKTAGDIFKRIDRFMITMAKIDYAQGIWITTEVWQALKKEVLHDHSSTERKLLQIQNQETL